MDGDTINRTKVELKYHTYPAVQYPVGYQSYQSGIEMQEMEKYRKLKETINRTKVELKSRWMPTVQAWRELSIVPKWN